jgi:quinol-cytochrome oxidoreductase complex cytochrome b subunit
VQIVTRITQVIHYTHQTDMAFDSV